MKAAHLNSSLNFLTLICYLQDDKVAKGVSNVTPTQVNPANTTANAKAQKGPLKPSLEVPGGPNLYQKSKKGSMTGTKRSEVCTNLS